MQVALCAMAKCENRYIKEWCDYHLELGFDHIFIYDNNEPDGERITDVVGGDGITVVDYRGRHQKSCETQVNAYNDCYRECSGKYDWVLFIDVDEFLTLPDWDNVKDFLAQDCFSNANAIRFHWKCYSDSGKLKYEEEPVLSRFTEPCENREVDKYYKQMYRCRIRGLNIKNVHYSSKIDGIKYPDGTRAQYVIQTTDNRIDHTHGCIRHYVTKSIEEFIDIKWKRRGPGGSKNRLNKAFYFKYNKKTDEKSRYFDEYFAKVSGKTNGNANNPKKKNIGKDKQKRFHR